MMRVGLVFLASHAGAVFLRSSQATGQMTPQDAKSFLDGIYSKLGNVNGEQGVGVAVSAADDDAFTKLYGNGVEAIKAETYGEVTLQGLDTLLQGRDPGGSFVDLGSGLGRSVLYACLAEGFDSCEGVELSKDRADIASRALAMARETQGERLRGVALLQGDLLQGDYFSKDVLFANNLLYPDSVQRAMAQKFLHVSQPGTVFIVTRELPEEVAQAARKEKVSAGVSWQQGGNDFFYKYTKEG